MGVFVYVYVLTMVVTKVLLFEVRLAIIIIVVF